VFGENDAMLEAKPTLEILMDIESRFMTLTETIQFICKNPPSNADIVRGLEADRKRKFRNEQIELRQQLAKDQAEN